jgi:16S rRNA A1518/A1519 N6-dimethyltransferase RsmA/KsgA/DIM1 with predicted DNA glycosylase/AP lyase activity
MKMFYSATKVKSGVLRLRRKIIVALWEKLFSLVKTAFQQRRTMRKFKTMNLSDSLEKTQSLTYVQNS